MFLHLLVGELQITPAVARHLGNQYKALQCLKLEIVHQNQLVEYGLISKETKIETLFPFHQTIHIPLDSYFEPIDGLNDDDELHHAHVQKLSFALFAVLGRQTMVKLGSGVMSSARSEKQKMVSKTVILRSDQFEIMGKVAVTTAYHDSLLDINSLLQLKKDSPTNSKHRQEQEYSFLLSRKFRRSEADFPATFDHNLDYQAKQDTKHYIDNLPKDSRTKPLSIAAAKKEHSPRKPSPKVVRRSNSQSRTGNYQEKQSHSRSHSHSVIHTLKGREQIHSGLAHTAEAPKLRKTVMSVGFVHNSWPDPLQHEREKREFQLRMADEKKQLLLHQIREEIEAQHRKSALNHEQHRQDMEAKKERRRKKQLARELHNRESEIKQLQDELHNIRLQSILATQQPSPPPFKGRYNTPSYAKRSSPHQAPTKSSSEKKRPSSTDRHRNDSANKGRESLQDQRIQQLIQKGFKNFFKDVPSIKEKPKKKPVATSSKEVTRTSPANQPRSKVKKDEKRSISPIFFNRNGPNHVKESMIETPIATTSELRDSQGNEIIKVSVTRHPSPKSSSNLRPTPLQARYQDIATRYNLPKTVSLSSADRNRTGSEFEFHDIYHRDPNHQKFDSDQDFSQLNEQFPRSSSNKTKSKVEEKKQKAANSSSFQDSHEDLESTRLLDDNEDEMKIFEQSMAEEIKAINQAIGTRSNNEPPVDQSIQSDSTNGAYVVPGFLQTMIQEQPGRTLLNNVADKFPYEHPPSYYADIDIEEDDMDPEDASSSTFDEDDFAKEYNLLVRKEDLDKASDESDREHDDFPRERKDSDDVDDYLNSKDLIFPAKDFEYAESSFQPREVSKEPQMSKTVVDDSLMESDPLGNEDKYEFEYRSNRSTATPSSRPHSSSSTRSRSREKIAQQFEKNRLYSQPASRPISNTIGNTVSTLTNTATSEASLPLDLANEREEGHGIRNPVDEELTYSQLDSLMEKASQAVTDAIRNVASDDSYDQAKTENNDHQPLKSIPPSTFHQIAMDISLSDDDTVENNILDSVSYNAKLMPSTSDEEENQGQQKVDDNEESPQEIQRKLDRISSRISSLLSDPLKQESISSAPLQEEKKAHDDKKEILMKGPDNKETTSREEDEYSHTDKRSVTFSTQLQRQFTDETRKGKPLPATVDYSRPSHTSSASKRSLIERQFEKNRRFTNSSPANTSLTATDSVATESKSTVSESPLPTVSSHINPQKLRWNDNSPTVTDKDLKTNYTIEFPATKSESVESIAVSLPAMKAEDNQSDPVIGDHREEEKQAETEEPVKHISPFKGSRPTESRVQSIISQFEKNRRYSSATTSTTAASSTAAGMNEQSISYPGLKRSPKAGLTPPISPPRNQPSSDKSPAAAKPSKPDTDDDVITSTVKKSNLQQDWLELEAALDKLETRVKTSDLMTNKTHNDRKESKELSSESSVQKEDHHSLMTDDDTPDRIVAQNGNNDSYDDDDDAEEEGDNSVGKKDTYGGDDSDTNSDDQEMLRKFMQEMDSDIEDL